MRTSELANWLYRQTISLEKQKKVRQRSLGKLRGAFSDVYNIVHQVGIFGRPVELMAYDD